MKEIASVLLKMFQILIVFKLLKSSGSSKFFQKVQLASDPLPL